MRPGVSGRLRAFTLVELIIAVTVVAILMALAIPSYRTYMLRASRSEATEALLNAARCQEQLYARFNAFDADACGGLTNSGLYTVTITTTNANQSFVASAAPNGGQADDVCATMTISDTGAKTADGKSGEYAQECWDGRSAKSSS